MARALRRFDLEDLVIRPGTYVLPASADLKTPAITIRGTDRNAVIIDAEFQRFIGELLADSLPVSEWGFSRAAAAGSAMIEMRS